MPQFRPIVTRIAPLAALVLFLWGRGGFAQSSTEEQGYQSALSSSLPFDLVPSQAKASFHLRRLTLHALYDAIARSYGIKLLYDSDLADRPVLGDFDMDDASLREALNAASSVSRTFVAPLDPHTGIVAADTAEKRAQFERQILGSFHLDNELTTQQLSEVSNALRTLVDLRRVTQDSRTNWITVLGRARQVEAAGQFVQTLDKPGGEVMLEFQVWEIDSSRARDMGILPPQPFTLQFLGTDPTAPVVPLLHWGQVQTLYGLQIPALTAFLNSSTSLVRSQEVMHLRATEGEEAQLLVGTRVPVVTGIVSSVIEASATSANITANTQGFIPGIQYQDTGVVIHATPHFHAGGEMTLQLDFALRDLGPTADNGIPSFTNRQLTSQFRLGYGEAYLLGGILNRTNQTSETGYPWLSRIPLIGRLFSHETKNSQETELLILVKPSILRTAAADQIASRSIFFGKELTGLPAPVEVPLLPAQPIPGAVPPQPGVPQPGVPAQPGVQPIPGRPPQPAVPGQPGAQPVPFPAGAFPQAFPAQPTPIQPQPYPRPQPPAGNSEQ
jgi:general secretion pathway protein D